MSTGRSPGQPAERRFHRGSGRSADADPRSVQEVTPQPLSDLAAGGRTGQQRVQRRHDRPGSVPAMIALGAELVAISRDAGNAAVTWGRASLARVRPPRIGAPRPAPEHSAPTSDPHEEAPPPETPAQTSGLGAPAQRVRRNPAIWWVVGFAVLALVVVAVSLASGLLPQTLLPSLRPEPQPGLPTSPGVGIGDVVQAALPLGLGIFWLGAAWLLDWEARRAFVRHEPWGDRLAGGYSCLAVGILAPLILAGVLLSAWGYVSFVLWLAQVQGWAIALRVGGAILGAVFLFLWLRSLLAGWWATHRQS